MPHTRDEPQTVQHIKAGTLSTDTAQTPGMQRYEAISGRGLGCEALWMGETRVAPGARSSNHHHGYSETAIYVLTGHPVFVVAEGIGERRIETSPGDYVYVPPFVPHREENPDMNMGAVVVIARSTQEAIVINLADLHADVRRP
ncbi:MAG: cupin domain-containing protein [Acidimicrobiales bacterium]